MGCCKCEEYNWPDPQDVVWEDPICNGQYCIFHAPADKKYITKGGKKYVAKSFSNGMLKQGALTSISTLLGQSFHIQLSFHSKIRSVIFQAVYLKEKQISQRVNS